MLAGEFDVRYIDRAVKRVLRAKFELGLFEDPYLEKIHIAGRYVPKNVFHFHVRLLMNRQYFENEGNLLPLDITKLQSVAVIGPNADCVQFGDYTWSKTRKMVSHRYKASIVWQAKGKSELCPRLFYRFVGSIRH